MLRWRHVEISGSFLVLMALLYYLDGGALLFPALLACAFHELGHFLAIALLGGRVVLLRLSCIGAEMRLSTRRQLNCPRELIAALAGPAANLFLTFAAAKLAPAIGEPGYVFAGLSLTLALFNLLPVPQLDGGRILKNALTLFGLERWAEGAVKLLAVWIGMIFIISSWVLTRRGQLNLTLMITAAWMIFPNLPVKEREKRSFS